MKRETTSIRIDPDVWHKFKVHCAENKSNLSEVLEDLIKSKLKIKT